MIIRSKITGVDDPLFSDFWSLYTGSFPLEERRTREAQQKIFPRTHYHLEAWHNAAGLLGFIGWWNYSTYRYAEHLAISLQNRSQGYGRRFLHEWLAESPGKVILEIDEVTDVISEKRLHFYESVGFTRNEYTHSHPHYQTGEGQVPLEILSYPDAVSTSLYQEFQHHLLQDVLGDLWD